VIRRYPKPEFAVRATETRRHGEKSCYNFVFFVPSWFVMTVVWDLGFGIWNLGFGIWASNDKKPTLSPPPLPLK
jgi:hypothetical protein